MKESSEKSRFLAEPIGEEITQVGFAINFIEIGFHGTLFRVYSTCKLTWNDTSYLRKDDEGIEAFWKIIGDTVSSVELHEGKNIVMGLKSSRKIEFSLDKSNEVLASVYYLPFSLDDTAPLATW